MDASVSQLHIRQPAPPPPRGARVVVNRFAGSLRTVEGVVVFTSFDGSRLGLRVGATIGLAPRESVVRTL